MPDYQNILQRSVNYIENRLFTQPTVEQVADYCGFSQYHFSRVFSIFTGTGIKTYMRERILSEAAKELLNSDITVKALSEKTGFGNPETFIRAFRKYFSMTPQAFRKKNQLIKYKQKMNVQICLYNTGGKRMDYKIKTVKEITLVGLQREIITKTQGTQINEMWKDLNDKIAGNQKLQIAKAVGLCFHDPRFMDQEPGPEDKWQYVTGIEIDPSEPTPAGLNRYTIPEHQYAIFTHKGSMKTVRDAYVFICCEWIKNVNYEFAPKDEFTIWENGVDQVLNDKPGFDMYIAVK